MDRFCAYSIIGEDELLEVISKSIKDPVNLRLTTRLRCSWCIIVDHISSRS